MSRVPVDPMLQVELARLVQAHGREAVRAACETALRRQVVDASDEQRARLAMLIDRLAGCWPRDQVMRLLMLHKSRGIPVEISLELLDRVASIRPANVWGLINTIMRKDYPTWS